MKQSKRNIYFSKQPTLPFEEWDEPASDAEPTDSVDSISDLRISEEEMADDSIRRPQLHYISLASGSSGNSCYIGNSEGGIVIDAGIRGDEIEDKLRRNNISMHHVKALLLTHDHSDHVRYSYNLLRNYRHLTLYCTPRVLNGLLRRHSISKRIKEYHTPIFKEIPFQVSGMQITAFEVPHDGTDNMGFFIEYQGHKFTLATDLGSVTERARHYMQQANYLVIESNYDSDMLRLGSYPEYLKARIRSANGHLDNAVTAEFVADIVNSELKYVFLCHLSKDNNTPALALKQMREALEARGLTVGKCENSIADRKADIQVMTLPRFDATRKFIFR